MKLVQKLKDRYNILLILLSLIFGIIILRLSYMNITKGLYYRELADNSRLREVRIDPSRGKIMDSYGRVLADNITTFSVQLMKDDIKEENINKTSLKLINILQEENEQIEDKFRIDLNVLYYSDIENYLNDISLDEEVVSILIKDKNIENLLSTVYIDKDYEFITGKIAISILEKKGIKPPIIIDFKDDKTNYIYDETKDIEAWRKANNIPSYLTPKETIARLIKDDDKSIKKLLNYPIIRSEIYNIFIENGLDEKFELKRYDFKDDKKVLEIKTHFRKKLSSITLNSSAKEDFINIITDYEIEKSDGSKDKTIKKMLSSKLGDEKNIIFGELLINELKKNDIEIPISIDSESDKITYSYLDKEKVIKFFKTQKLWEYTKYIDENTISVYSYEKNKEYELTPIDLLIEFSKSVKSNKVDEMNIIGQLITSDELKYIAQVVMLDLKIDPNISVAKWKYRAELEKEIWLGSIIKEQDLDNYSAEKVFDKLREKYDIPKNLNNYQTRFIYLFRELFNQKNLRAYEPIDISYDVKEVTVSKILENQNQMIGVDITAVPTRYYPMDETASHVLGYLGKISAPWEIDKYKDNSRYELSDRIGKSGIENKFEEYLKGSYGTKKVEVDVYGRTKRVLEETKPIPGNNIFLSIDAKLQKVAEDSLKQAIEQIQIGGEFKSKWGNYSYKKSNGKVYKNATSGTIVAIDVKTGKVLALANYPTYDPNLFIPIISNENWDSLNKNENNPDLLAPRPLLNMALQTPIQPGSTFKMITGLAALEKGIDPRFEINSRGYIEVGKRTFGDWQWNDYRQVVGNTNLYEALKDSVNYYFYTVSAGINLRTNEPVLNRDYQKTKVDIEDITRLATEFGLDDKTGIEIDIPTEVSGKVPKPSIKVNQIKNSLRKFLSDNIKDYLLNKEMKNSQIDSIIEEIVSWIDYDELLSRGHAIKKLRELGVDAYKKIPDENKDEIDWDPFVDRIKYTYLNQGGWSLGDTLNVSIGQGDNAYTSLQMANYIATLTNEGYKNKVSIIDSLSSFNGTDIDYDNKTKPTLIDVKHYKNIKETDEEKAKRIKQYLNELKKGMLLVTTEGTSAKTFNNFPIKVGAKTGTAENQGIIPGTNEQYDSFGWFVAFAPYDDPQIAIAGLIVQGGSGGNVSPAAREIIAEYLGLSNVDEKMTFNNKLVK